MKAPEGGRIPVSQNAEGLAVRVGSLLRSPLAPYALVSLALNLSFAQVEASFVLVLRDYLDFGAQQTGWLFAYVGVCIILVQAFLIRRIVGRLAKSAPRAHRRHLLILAQVLTVFLVLGLLPGNAAPLVQMLVVTTGICFGYAIATPAIGSATGLPAPPQWAGRLAWFRALARSARWSGWWWPARSMTLAGRNIRSASVAITLAMLLLIPYLARPGTPVEAG